jgi:pilus assembly protein Flp/PilA
VVVGLAAPLSSYAPRVNIMRKFVNHVQKLGKDEEGAALADYTVLLGILVVAVIVTIGLVAKWNAGLP